MLRLRLASAAAVLAMGAIAVPSATAIAAPITDAPSASSEIQALLDAQVPRRSSQAVLVTGDGSNYLRLVAISRWQRDASGLWVQIGETARGHIGARGWGKERAGDMKTPVGTYTLTAAGGYLPAPSGTRLPYDFRPERYLKPGSRFADYVVRINWNVRKSYWSHVPADTPSKDWNRGSGIWLHADSRYDTPTAGCVSQPRKAMRATLRWLDPALDPVIVLAPGPMLVAQPWQ